MGPPPACCSCLSCCWQHGSGSRCLPYGLFLGSAKSPSGKHAQCKLWQGPVTQLQLLMRRRQVMAKSCR